MQSPCACLTEALLIRATADLMRLPQAAAGSALVFLHRFHSAPPKLNVPEQVSPLLRRSALTCLSHVADRGVCWALFTCGRSEACCCMPVPGYQSRRGAAPFGSESSLLCFLVLRHAGQALLTHCLLSQTPTRTNDLLNAVRFAALHLRTAADPAGQGTPALPDYQAPQQPAPFAPLVGEQYYAAKEQLILDEQARTSPSQKWYLVVCGLLLRQPDLMVALGALAAPACPVS